MDLWGRKSHRIVEDSLQILLNLDHRGARGADEDTGDGAGIMLQKPHEFYRALVPDLGDFDSYGTGLIFFPKSEAERPAFTPILEEIIKDEEFELLAWRDVPTDGAKLGRAALQTEPLVRQLFVRPRALLAPEELDGRLYVLRRVMENTVANRELDRGEEFYICSLDRRKIVYKGLLTNAQLGTYFPDLLDSRVESSLALVHARFSTNTLGSWKLAHPYRHIVHNGEINTLRGNYNWMRAREADLEHPKFGADIEKLKPVTTTDQSDTAMLDDVFGLIVESGRSLPHAVRMLIPEAWSKDPSLDPRKRDWYEYHSTLVEPWAGPALVAFSDGDSVGAVLDRNGFRPCRYAITRDKRLVMASEFGVLDLDPAEIVEMGRLKPGQMFWADAGEGRILSEAEVFERLTDHPHGSWLEANRVRLDDRVATAVRSPAPPVEDVTALQCAFGYTLENLEHLVRPMAEDGADPLGAMGDDAPPAVLSQQARSLFSYFRQSFAQVSNPPVDYLREELVTSLESHVGRQRNFLDETPEHCRQLLLRSPILRNAELAAIRTLSVKGIRARTLDMTYEKGVSLSEAIQQLGRRVIETIAEGYEIIVLSDRDTGPERVPIPSLLAVGALHQRLIREGLRMRAALVLESGDPHLIHHFACLIGYSAAAVNPYLAFESLRRLVGSDGDAWDEAVERYIQAVEQGVLKVMSKMGISVLESYKGAQIFEAIGLSKEFVGEYFEGTVSRIGGIGLDEVEEDVLERHRRAFGARIESNLRLEQGGEFYWRRDGEIHQWNPETIGLLQSAVRTGDEGTYRRFAERINRQDRQLQTLRGLLDFKTSDSSAIGLEEVEPVESICRRFFTSSMSFGALSKETHEALAVAMNRIGGVACTGEGGEEAERFGTERECANKQVGSARFGVTHVYLANARAIEIKMAQGAKPGEGGQLPGVKVDETIARVRFSLPGVDLISPPPHHDIYSIEDIAQLIHDLKCSNPAAEVHVKLVAEAGVGTIAAGVAKARADAILIAGDSGGTGAASKTSIKFAGMPWELGLTEAHQVLLENRLRSRVRLRVDGGLKTGRDVVIAAMLGAEEYGFGTAPVVALGCIMLRKCHCNTCSVGVATHDPELRKRFPGRAEHVVNYMRFVAGEVRELMAGLGFRSIDEVVGRVDRLVPREVNHRRARRLDLSPLLYQPESEDDRRKTREQYHKLEYKLDHCLNWMVRMATDWGKRVDVEMPITNHDRSYGAMLSSLLGKRYGFKGLPDDTIWVRLTGVAGQSLGAFLAPGITLDLTGAANDYVGKGLSGGKLMIRTPPNSGYEAGSSTIIGNVALYGATRGELYVNGVAGERFAVRNSGAMAVVEGVGNHGCEYMTGGVVVVLGEVGRNFAAGMSGGEAFLFYDEDPPEAQVNPGMVDLIPLEDTRDVELVRRLVENHKNYVNSSKAKAVLEDWKTRIGRCVKVMPKAYARVVESNLEQGIDIRVGPPPAAAGASAAVL